jgi:drug/metabolite transporter (DMT)-like permease
MEILAARRRAFVQIHFCVLLWGFTAILGKLISLAALPLVWWRMLLVSAALLLVPRVWRALRNVPLRLLLAYAGIGVLVALHWVTFYAAIKLANASVAATCIALGPVFLAVVEPLMQRRGIAWRDLLLGAAMLPGVALVVGGIPQAMLFGVLVGVLSALLVAIFGSLNKLLVEHADPLAVTGIELGAGTLALTLLAPVLAWLLPEQAGGAPWTLPEPKDWLWLGLLAFGCTLLPFALSLIALRQLSAFSAQLAVNLEPIYAIALAALLFGEQQEVRWTFYLGAAIVVAGVFLHPLLHRHAEQPRSPEVLAVAESKSLE